MSLIINKTASDGSLFQGWGRSDLSGEENTATNKNKGFLSIRNSNAVPNQIERAKQHGRQTISRVAKKERRIDSKVKLYKDRGDRIADRIKEIEQDEKNNQRMIEKLAEEYDIDLMGRDYKGYRDLDRVARHIMGFSTSYDDNQDTSIYAKQLAEMAAEEPDPQKELLYEKVSELPAEDQELYMLYFVEG